MVEAKQLPVEHPKDYHPVTGLTSWGSGAFSLVRRRVFELVGGFDEQTFFLYCDDVDLSWRIREAGYDVVHQPSAVVFHDKALTTSARWAPTEAERHFSAQASLLLAHKWSRDDVVEQLTAEFERSDVLSSARHCVSSSAASNAVNSCSNAILNTASRRSSTTTMRSTGTHCDAPQVRQRGGSRQRLRAHARAASAAPCNVTPGAIHLDLACGFGHIAEHVVERFGLHYVGVDLDRRSDRLGGARVRGPCRGPDVA